MKTIITISLFLLFPIFSVRAQTSCINMFEDGEKALKSENYRSAILKLQAASKCDPSLGPKVDEKILLAFDKIQALTKRAEKERKMAEENLNDISDLISDITDLLQRDENEAIIGLEPLQNDIFQAILPYQKVIRDRSSKDINDWKFAKTHLQIGLSLQRMGKVGFGDEFKKSFEISFSSVERYKKNGQNIPNDLVISLLNSSVYYGWYLMDQNLVHQAEEVLLPTYDLIKRTDHKSAKSFYAYAKFDNALNRLYHENKNYKKGYIFLKSAIENMKLALTIDENNLLYKQSLAIYQRNLKTLRNQLTLTKDDKKQISEGCNLASEVRSSSGSGTLAITTVVDCVLEKSYEFERAAVSYKASKSVRDLIEELSSHIHVNPSNKSLYLFRARLYSRLFSIIKNRDPKSSPYYHLEKAKDDWIIALKDNTSLSSRLWEIESVYHSINDLPELTKDISIQKKYLREMEEAIIVVSRRQEDPDILKIIAGDVYLRQGKKLKENKGDYASILEKFNTSIDYYRNTNILEGRQFNSKYSWYASAIYQRLVLNYDKGNTDLVLQDFEMIEKLFRPILDKYPFDFYIHQYFILSNLLTGDLLFKEKKYKEAIPYLKYASKWGKRFSSRQLATIYREGYIGKKDLAMAISLDKLALKQTTRSVTVEVDYGTYKAPINITIHEYPRDYKYKGIDNNVQWFHETGGIISPQIAQVFRNLQQEAWEKDISFPDWCVKNKFRYTEKKGFEYEKYKLEGLLKVDTLSKAQKILEYDKFISNYREKWSKKASDANEKEYQNIIYGYINYMINIKDFEKARSVAKNLTLEFPKNNGAYRILAKAEIAEYEVLKTKNSNVDHQEVLTKSDHLSALGVYYRYFLKKRDKEASLYWQKIILKVATSKKSEDLTSFKFLMFEFQVSSKFYLFEELYLTNNDPERLRKDITYFISQIGKEKKNEKREKYYKYLIKLEEHLLSISSDESIKNTLGSHYNSLAWYQLLTSKFKESEITIKAGLKIDPDNMFFYTNLPATLLLQGKYRKAQKLYKKWKNIPFDVDERYATFKEAFIDDFKTFKKEGIIPEERMLDVEKVISFLNS